MESVSYTKKEIEKLISIYVSVVDQRKSIAFPDENASLNHDLFIAEENLKGLYGSGPLISNANPKYVEMCENRECYVGEVDDEIGTVMIKGTDDLYVWVPVFIPRSKQDEEIEYDE